MKNYRIFLENGDWKDLKQVTEIEITNFEGKKSLVFLFENKEIDYTLPLTIIHAVSVLDED